MLRHRKTGFKSNACAFMPMCDCCSQALVYLLFCSASSKALGETYLKVWFYKKTLLSHTRSWVTAKHSKNYHLGLKICVAYWTSCVEFYADVCAPMHTGADPMQSNGWWIHSNWSLIRDVIFCPRLWRIFKSINNLTCLPSSCDGLVALIISSRLLLTV